MPMALPTKDEMLEQSYRESVEALERLKSSKVFQNGMPVHAAIIFETFFRHAKKAVKIFCRNLSRDVFDEPWLLEAAQKAVLERGVSLSVFVKEQPDQSSFLNWLRRNEGHPAVVFASNVSDEPSAHKQFNFATMDGRAYRFEPNENEVAACACMNDRETTMLLDNFFSRLSKC